MKLALQPISSSDCEMVASAKRFPFSQETSNLIEAGWKTVLSARPDDFGKGLLFDKLLLRVENAFLEADSLHMKLIEDVSYRDVVGLRANDFLHKIPESDVFQVASLILLIQSADGSILLTERNSGDWEHSFELPGGFITSEKLQAAGGDSKKLARLIAKNEVGLDDTNIHSFEYIGALPFEKICEYMLIFRITLTADFVLSPVLDGKSRKLSRDPFTENLELPLHYPSGKVLELLY